MLDFFCVCAYFKLKYNVHIEKYIKQIDLEDLRLQGAQLEAGARAQEESARKCVQGAEQTH